MAYERPGTSGSVWSEARECKTAPVAYHEAFWVASAAAAPVIALANVVTVSDAWGLARESVRTLVSVAEEIGQPSMVDGLIPRTRTAEILYRVSLVNLVLQAAVLLASMISLADTGDHLPPMVVAAALAGGLAAVGAAAMGMARARQFPVVVAEMWEIVREARLNAASESAQPKD